MSGRRDPWWVMPLVLALANGFLFAYAEFSKRLAVTPKEQIEATVAAGVAWVLLVATGVLLALSAWDALCEWLNRRRKR